MFPHEKRWKGMYWSFYEYHCVKTAIPRGYTDFIGALSNQGEKPRGNTDDS